jgi:hypothetical protein
MKIYIFLLIMGFSLCGSIQSQIVISEVLANEPGSRVYLEWIEIYNNGDRQDSLKQYQLVDGNDTLAFSDTLTIASDDYAVICRRLLPIDGSDCFEYHWGDSSGVWGDSPIENYPAFTMPIALSNSSGDIYLLDSLDQVIDQCHWRTACADGQSLERDDVLNLSSGWHPCSDSTGSTPGKANSPLPPVLPDSLFIIDNKVVSLSSDQPFFTISYAFPSGTKTSISIYDDSGRRRCILADNSSEIRGAISWQCQNNNGDKLPPGLYLLKLHTIGPLNLSKTYPLVIAP